MTKPKAPPETPNPNRLTIVAENGVDPEETSTRILVGPFVSNAFVTTTFGKGVIGTVELDHTVTALAKCAKAVKANDLSSVEDMLTSQAIALNMMFAELSRRSAVNMGSYMDASRQYMNMALKAQNQCRMTLETLSVIKNPPVVYAKQANIANGPQQVNNGIATASHASETGNAPNKLLETSHDSPLDHGTARTADRNDRAVAAMGEVNRPQDA